MLRRTPRENFRASGDIYIMALDKATVARIATLARIKVPESELEQLAGELSHILTWIEQLGEVNTDGVEPMASVAEMTLPMREDRVTMVMRRRKSCPTPRSRRTASSWCPRWWSDGGYSPTSPSRARARG